MDALNARLLDASEEGRTEEASGLLDQGAEIETRDEASQCTSLHLSAWRGHVGTMKMLLDRGANIEAKAIHNCTPLHLSALRGQVHAVRLLLDRGANIEAKNVGQVTPLHVACAKGHMEVITLLVDRDASLDAVNVYQQNCLHYAAFNDRLDVCLYLIDVKGFDPAVLNSKGWSAISHYGCFVGTQNALPGDDRPALTPEVEQVCVAMLVAARETHLQRIRDENWAKNWVLMRVVVECGFRPMAAQAAALLAIQAALDPAVPIAPVSRDTPEENRLYLQHAVLGNDGLLRHIVSFIPVPRELAELSLPLSQRHLTRERKAASLK